MLFDWCEVIPHCSFDLPFTNDYCCWAYFHVPVGYLYVFFVEMCNLVFCQFFLGLFATLLCYCDWVIWAVCIFWKLSPCHLHGLQKFLPSPRLSFHFAYGFLCWQKLICFIRSYLFILIFSSITLEIEQRICCHDLLFLYPNRLSLHMYT